MMEAHGTPSVEDAKPPGHNAQEVLDEPRTAPDLFDDKYRATKWEIWAYYACVTS